MGLAVFLWIVWLFGTSRQFGDCIRNRKEYEAYQSLQEEPFFIVKLFVRFHLNSACAAHTADAYNGAITALAGFAVAVFTLALWRSTDKMWKLGESQRITDTEARVEESKRFEASLKVSSTSASAAKTQADAAIGLALPRFEIEHATVPLRIYVKGRDEEGSVYVSIKNHGGSSAVLIEQAIKYSTTPFLANIPHYAFSDIQKSDLGHILEVGKSTGLTAPIVNYIGEITGRGDSLTLWVHGYVVYRDFLDGLWQYRFCLVSERMPGGSLRFVEANHYPEYTGRSRYDPSKPRDDIDYSLPPILDQPGAT